jgi:hypothetical protein
MDELPKPEDVKAAKVIPWEWGSFGWSNDAMSPAVRLSCGLRG